MTQRPGSRSIRGRVAGRFRRLTIAQKIYLTPVALLLLLLLLMGFALGQARIAFGLNDADRQTAAVLEQAYGLELALTRMEAGARGYSRTGADSFLARYQDGKEDFARGIARLAGLENGPSDRELLSEIQRQAAQEDEIFLRPIIAARQSGAVRSSVSVAGDQDLTLAVAVRDNIDAYIGARLAAARRAQDDSDAALRALVLGMLAGLLGIAATLIPADVLVGRSLSRRVRRVDRSAKAVADGALDAALPAPEGGDEIDSMARSIERMAQTLRHRIAGESAARETAEQATRSKDEFFRRAGHELRTPLNAILGFSELLQGRVSTLGERESRYLRQVRDAGARLHTLLEEVLTLADLASGPSALRLQPVDAGELLRPMGSVAAERCATAGLTFELTMPDAPAQLRVDVARLHAALTELIEDAVRSCARGARVSLAARLVDASLALELFHSGAAPDAVALGRWFEPFPAQFAADARSAQPTQVGRLFARRVVELHGGCVVAEGTPDGVTIRLTLPLATHQAE